MTGLFNYTTQSKKNPKKNAVETLRETPPQNPKKQRDSTGSVFQDVKNDFKDIGSGIFEQILGTNSSQPEYNEQSHERKVNPAFKPLFGSESISVFSWAEQEKRREIDGLKELINTIKEELALIKKQDAAFMSDVKDVEKITLHSNPEKPGVYHVRFLEIIISLLRNIRAKISESSTWLQALQSKKNKRGSAFAKLSKEKGTQYSMSQEFSVRNSVQ